MTPPLRSRMAPAGGGRLLGAASATLAAPSVMAAPRPSAPKRFIDKVFIAVSPVCRELPSDPLTIALARPAGLFNALYSPRYERITAGSSAPVPQAWAMFLTPFALAILRA